MKNRLSHTASVLIALVVLSGCRLPLHEGPIPQSLAACRQFSQQGVTAIEAGRWEDAETLLAKAVEACPEDTEARRHYAEVLWHRGSKQAAVRQLEQAAVRVSKDAALHVRIAQMQLEMGQLRPARRHAERAVDLDPKMSAAWATRGSVARAAGQAQAALADYHRALGCAADDRTVLLEIAKLYRQLNEPEQALSVLHTLADTYPPGEEPQQVDYLKGLAYAALGRHAAAAESLSAAVMRERPTAEILYRLGEAELLAGHPDAAAAAAEKALSLNPKHRPSQELLGRIGLARQNKESPRR